MKARNTTIASLAAALILCASASCSRDRGMNTPGKPAPQFASSEEAAAQGRRDLLEALRLSPDLRLGVERGQVEQSTAAPAIPVTDIDFGKLLATDGVADLEQLAAGERGNATPLQVAERVVATIETSRDGAGWRVSAIGNQSMTQELNAIRDGGFDTGGIRYFEVPNIDARIYALSATEQAQYLTSYGGFSLRQPVTIEQLLPRLRQGAAEFQRLYGDELKKGKLVK